MSKLISKTSRSLHDAISEGDLEAMRHVLKELEGAFKDEVNNIGETALYLAAEKGL
jgi:hypothetical protein